MSYPKKRQGKQTGPKYNTKLSQKRRDKLIALQQKEQLKSLLVSKFVEKYGKVKGNKEFIAREVNALLKSGKITETNLKSLEDKIKLRLQMGGAGKGAGNAGGAPKQAPQGPSGGQDFGGEPMQQSPGREELAPAQGRGGDQWSETTSQAPRSVYLGGNEKDEWATIMKFDTELYKKEQEMEKLRLQEQKKKMRADLQRQIQEKKKLKSRDDQEDRAYFELQLQQMKRYDQRETTKASEMKNKLMQEKLSRDRQLHDENQRKRFELKKEKELDQRMVKQIEKELVEEQKQTLHRKKEERLRLREMLEDNERNKLVQKKEAEIQRLKDIEAQKEYTRLIEQQEKKRADEMADRERRQRQFMDMMAETVIKDHKAKQEDEDKRILAQYLAREKAELVDEKKRKARLQEQRIATKNYLLQQVKDKGLRQDEEERRNKIQAEIWKKEAEEYVHTEKEKSDYIRDLNKEHASILLSMFKDAQHGGLMNENELLMNKGQLKHISVNKEGETMKSKKIKPDYKKLYAV